MKKVKTICFGIEEEWSNREEAKEFFLEAILSSSGLMQQGFKRVYDQLVSGLDVCTDEEELNAKVQRK